MFIYSIMATRSSDFKPLISPTYSSTVRVLHLLFHRVVVTWVYYADHKLRYLASMCTWR